jgi:hypothetical protein
VVCFIPNGAKGIVMTAHSVLLIIEYSPGLGSQQKTMLMATDHCSLITKTDAQSNGSSCVVCLIPNGAKGNHHDNAHHVTNDR